MKFTPKSYSDRVSCLLAEFSIEIGFPEEARDKAFAARFNKILDKYHKKMMSLVRQAPAKLLICLMLVVSINLVCGLISPVFAEPTPPHRRLLWDANDWTIDPDLAGYWLYYAPKSEPEPRAYNNLRRIQLTNPNVNEIFLIDVKPDATSGLCFKITAYDVSGNESGFSNEACGWFGMSTPKNLMGMP